MSPKKIDAYFKEKNLEVEQSSIKINHREINYVRTGSDQKPLILFVHGSPGSLSAFIHFLADSALLKQFMLISTDRAGFGYSNFGFAEPSINKQAEL
ncbi:MAG TPA: alpha/beta hydrolase, partial [Cyclobacteriaceae bacterium]|nr:alpha/beta hydrolase [Cyclobacteriaceae bacterium]